MSSYHVNKFDWQPNNDTIITLILIISNQLFQFISPQPNKNTDYITKKHNRNDKEQKNKQLNTYIDIYMELFQQCLCNKCKWQPNNIICTRVITLSNI